MDVRDGRVVQWLERPTSKIILGDVGSSPTVVPFYFILSQWYIKREKSVGISNKL